MKTSFQYYTLSSRFTFFILLFLVLLSCKTEEIESTEPIEPEVDLEILAFSFLTENNPSLNYDIHLSIDDSQISGILPVTCDFEQLVATFEHIGTSIKIDDIEQTSSITSNDYTDVVDYMLQSETGDVIYYEIDLTYFTGLPIIYLATDGDLPIDSTDEYREGNAVVIGGRDYLNLSETDMKIRGRGHSTWYFHPKKPYQLKFSDETAILNMPAEKKWIFLAEHSDKTLIRNRTAFEMGHISVLDWTPRSAFAEVFINDSYNGTYHITEKVEVEIERVNIGDNGYLLEIDNIDHIEADDVIFYTNNFLLNIKEPDLIENSAEYNYIKDLINEFETVLNSSQFNDPIIGYPKYIDVDSFVDWYLINEITKNQDARSYSSIYLNVIPGEKIKMGPIWDFDLAFGNVNYSDCEYPEGFWVKDNAWYTRLFLDEEFKNKVKSRFQFFRQNQNYILEKIDSNANYLNLAQQENNAKWNVIGTYIWPNPVVLDSYDGEVQRMKTWYNTRMNWLENAINNL